MKFRYIIALFAAAAMLAGCTDETAKTYLDNVQVSSSYVSISPDGGSTDITVTAKDSWTITVAEEDAWLTVSPASGAAGTATVTFSADATEVPNTTTVYLECGGERQNINVIQQPGEVEVPLSTVAEVLAGVDAVTYKVRGIVTVVSSDYYGNMYIKDESTDETLYIYGTQNAAGAYPKSGENWDFVSVGDEVIVQGPRTTYKDEVELVDAELVEVIKSLISVNSVTYLNTEEEAIPLDGGSALVSLACSGNDINVNFAADCDWLSVSYTNLANGVATVILSAAGNESGDRSTTVTFTTVSEETTYTSEAVISQKGAILEVSLAEFNAAAIGETYYRLSGIVTEVVSEEKGRFYIQDYSGSTYVFGLGNFSDAGIAVGDIVTLIGQHDEYNGIIEVVNPELEKLTDVTEVTIAEFLTKEDAKDVFYMVTGEISEIEKDQYGNLYITDDSTDEPLYVYGCYGYGATGNDKYYFLSGNNIVVGDTITLIGYKTTYDGTIELVNGFYVTHTSASAE